MGRKPKYENPQSIIDAFYQSVSDAYNSPGEGEQGRDGKKQELLAEEFGISRIKVRKILVTTGDISYPQTTQIQEMMKNGMKMGGVCEKLRISPSTANSLIPYSKGVYKLTEVSAAAERTQLYRERKEAVKQLQKSMVAGTMEEMKTALWSCVCIFAGYPFITSGRGKTPGSPFKYCVSEPGGAGGRRYEGPEVKGFGNEIFVKPASGEDKGKKREKGISRSSVDYAFNLATTSTITGPKQLKIYGASYVYAVFVRFGVISSPTNSIVPGMEE